MKYVFGINWRMPAYMIRKKLKKLKKERRRHKERKKKI
jgi:hypothetical protein